MARATVRLDGDETPCLLSVADLLEDYGVLACLVSEDAVPAEVAADPVEPAPRAAVGASLVITADGWVAACHGSITDVVGDENDITGQRLARRVHPLDRLEFEEALAAGPETRAMGRRIRMRLRTSAGGWRWVDALLHDHWDSDGSLLVCVLNDIDTDIRAQQAQADSELRLRTFLEAVPIGVFGADDVGRIRFANDAFRTVTGIDPACDDWLSIIHPEDVADLVDAVQRFGFGGDVLDTEIRLRPRGRSEYRTARLMARAVRADDGKLLDVVGSIEDITERKLLAEELAHEASHDGLTGLANRSALERDLTRRLEGEHSAREPVAVLFIDLDGFTRINDSLGHSAGDELLLRLAERLTASARPNDLVGRFGGDEFVVVSEHAGGADGALAMAHRLLDELCEPVEVGGTTLRPRASIGVAIGTGGETAATLLRDADAAMYEAKGRGPRGVWLADAEVRRRAARRFGLEGALADALVDDEYAFAYQPVIDLLDGRPVWAEALLRWDSTQFGPTSPAEIIPVAEETGLIHELTTWSAVRAARDLCRFRSTGPSGVDFRVSINLSCSQLSAPGFVDRYLATLAGEGVGPEDIVVEVTETDLVEVASAAGDALDALAENSVSLALDDFGAGFSSFEYLTRLPIQILKVDRSLIAQASQSGRARTVLSGIVSICDDLGIVTIAEGIETPAERAACVDSGIMRGQGYLIARPMPAEDLIRWRTPTPAAAAQGPRQ